MTRSYNIVITSLASEVILIDIFVELVTAKSDRFEFCMGPKCHANLFGLDKFLW